MERSSSIVMTLVSELGAFSDVAAPFCSVLVAFSHLEFSQIRGRQPPLECAKDSLRYHRGASRSFPRLPSPSAFEKASLVAKFKGARDRKKAQTESPYRRAAADAYIVSSASAVKNGGREDGYRRVLGQDLIVSTLEERPPRRAC